MHDPLLLCRLVWPSKPKLMREQLLSLLSMQSRSLARSRRTSYGAIRFGSQPCVRASVTMQLQRCGAYLHIFTTILTNSLHWPKSPSCWYEHLSLRTHVQTRPEWRHHYILDARIERAKSLLLGGDLSIAEVAQKVGFLDQSHFTRYFKRLVGITPQILLRQNSKNVLK